MTRDTTTAADPPRKMRAVTQARKSLEKIRWFHAACCMVRNSYTAVAVCIPPLVVHKMVCVDSAVVWPECSGG